MVCQFTVNKADTKSPICFLKLALTESESFQYDDFCKLFGKTCVCITNLFTDRVSSKIFSKRRKRRKEVTLHKIHPSPFHRLFTWIRLRPTPPLHSTPLIKDYSQQNGRVIWKFCGLLDYVGWLLHSYSIRMRILFPVGQYNLPQHFKPIVKYSWIGFVICGSLWLALSEWLNNNNNNFTLPVQFADSRTV